MQYHLALRGALRPDPGHLGQPHVAVLDGVVAQFWVPYFHFRLSTASVDRNRKNAVPDTKNTTSLVLTTPSKKL